MGFNFDLVIMNLTYLGVVARARDVAITSHHLTTNAGKGKQKQVALVHARHIVYVTIRHE